MTYKLYLNDRKTYYIINEHNNLRTDRCTNFKETIDYFNQSSNLSKVTVSTSRFHHAYGTNTLIATFSSIEDLYAHYPELFI